MITEDDLSCYRPEMNELVGWLGDGEKSDREFDREFSDSRPRKCRVVAFDTGAPILGSLSQGFGPNCWAGRLDLLQHMVKLGFVSRRQEGDAILYSLGEQKYERV